jgi:transposase
VLFPGLSSLVMEEVTDQGSVVRVGARTAALPVGCPRCGVLTRRVHAYHRRRLVDVPVVGRGLVVDLQVRRLACPRPECPQRTFREQVPGLTQRWARRTPRLMELTGQVAVMLAGRAGAALLGMVGVRVSRSTMLRTLMSLPIPTAPTPKVLSVDDVALARGQRYATMVIDAVTHRRVDVLPDRKAATLTTWLREHPGAQIVCRDGSASYAEAIRQGAPTAVQVSDRWHLWHGLAGAVEKIVVAHSGCWRATVTATPPEAPRPIEARTRARHAAVHDLLGQGLGLLECARRLGWGLNTVKRYARANRAEDLIGPRRFRATLVDPYRDHLRQRLIAEADVPVTRLLAEIREQGYPGSANLLVRYLKQGRADTATVPPAPRRLTCWIMTRPQDLTDAQRHDVEELLGLCPHLQILTDRVRRFADLLTSRRGGDLPAWMTTVEADDLPALHSFVQGLHRDLDAAVAGLTLPYSNGPMEGSNTKVKLLKRQMYAPRRIPPTAPTHPARLTRSRVVTTVSVPEPSS